MPTLVLSALAIVGVAMLVRRRAWMILLIVLVSVAIILMAWRNQFSRYLMPLTPFLAIGVMVAFDELFAALSTLPARPAIATFGQITLAVLVSLALMLQIDLVQKLFYNRALRGASYVQGRGAMGPRFFIYRRSIGRQGAAL